MEFKQAVWNKHELLPKQEASNEEIKKIKRAVEKLKVKRKVLRKNIKPENFIKIIEDEEKLSIRLSRLSAYAQLWFDENTSNDKAINFRNRIAKLNTEINNELMFISLWFKKINEKTAKKIIAKAGKYRYMLEHMRKTRKFALDEDKEQIINFKDLTGAEALTSIYSIITNKFAYEVDGKKLNRQEVSNLARSPSRITRKKAYKALLGEFAKQKEVLAEIYKNIVKDIYYEGIVIRKYPSAISMRNLSNDLPDESVESLLRVCKKNEALMQEYFKRKAKELKLRTFKRYDIYAPVSPEQSRFRYGKAIKIVLETFRGFSDEFYSIAKELLKKKHLHSIKTPNKRQGAYCLSVEPGVYPYVLVNFNGTLNDVSTIAHELGHAIHYVLASRQNSYFNAHASLPLAETASIFSEMLLSEHIRKTNPELKKEILFHQLDNIYASITRQAGFVRFEQTAHSIIPKEVTTEEIAQIYYKQLKEQLKGVVVPEEFKWEWLSIPHIYESPFYCYAYSFGNLLVLSLYSMYKKKSDEFVPKFTRLLSRGSSKPPIMITKEMGIDITKDKFWQQGFDLIKEMIDELE